MSTAQIEFSWQSTPQLWMAYRPDICQCPECHPPYGLGKTREDAALDLLEQEEDARG